MATKPAQLCQLKKGKLVDTQQGFVDTFNWAVNAIANLTGGQNCEVTWPVDDTPTIDVTAEEGNGAAGGGGGSPSQPTNVQFTGNYPYPNPTTASGDSFTITSASNANVKIECSNQTIYIGAYYI